MRYAITFALTSFLLTAADATLVAQKGNSAHGSAKSADTAKAPKTHTAPATKENGGGKPSKTATTTSGTSSTGGTTTTNNTSTSGTSTATTGASTSVTTTT